MSSLNKFLSRFSSITIQRSASYVQHIDLETLDIMTEGPTTVAYAQIEGTDYYDTTIEYHSTLNRLTETDCSCPVGFNCKHAAALARFFYAEYLDPAQLQATQGAALRPQLHNQQPNFREAEQWLNQFKQHLSQASIRAVNPHKQLIYILNQKNNKLDIETAVHKVRRNKAGEIRDTAIYTSYDNILNQRLKLSESERTLFSQIYFYAKLNQVDHFYIPHLDLVNIPLNIFKSFIETGLVHWQHYQNTALSWTDTPQHLEFEWKNGIQSETEKLELYIVDQQQRRIILNNNASDFCIFPSQPLCYIDTAQNLIGPLTSDYSAALLQHLLSMPALPVALLSQFDQLLHSQPLSLPIPQPQYLQELSVVEGRPVAIIRFGAFSKLEQRLAHDQYAFAEIEFEYQAGRIKAGSSVDSFMGSLQDQAVKQMRDLQIEQQYLQQLKDLIPSLQQANQLGIKQSKFELDISDDVVCADPQDWIAQLLPVNQFELLGWQVEHTAQSMFNLELAHNIEFSLEPSAQRQDWFDVGVTVQDPAGNSYNLIDLLANLIQQSPQLLNTDYMEQLDEQRFLNISVHPDRPQLSISAQEIKPILLYLKDILQQPESRQVDRYDASQLLELQHQLGLEWQSQQRLKDFAAQLKQGYQQYLPTPAGFQGELRGYQQQGLAWLQFLAATDHAGILADDMGLGKTAQTLAHLLLEQQAGHLKGHPALIIAPTSLMQNWFKEAAKFTPDLKVLLLHGTQRHALFEQIPDYDIVLTTYPLLTRDQEHLQKYQYHVLILDEAQNIKNPRAKAAQVARQLTAKHRLCLTGTPMENHLGELWSLFYFLMPGFLYTQEVFNKTYRHPIEKQGDQQKKNKLVARIQPFLMRRLKTDVAKELPAKTTIEVNIEMNDQQAKLYEAVRASMQDNIRQIIAEKGFKRSQIQILDALLKLRQVCCHPSLLKLDTFKSQQASSAKLDYLMEMVTEMVEEGRRILIFSQFTSMLQLIEAGLQAQNIPLVKLTGQTKKRDQVITAFQSGDIPVFLISLKAGGVGLNLTAADTVIHYDPWWNPAAEDQASDRAWRIGQDKPVFVYKLVTNQSIEEKIILMQKAKAQLAQSILSVDQENEVKLSEDDVMKLFE